jgi:hypothetical protein
MASNPQVGSAEWFSIESRKLLRRIGMAGLEALAFGASVLFHLVMRFAIREILPSGYSYVQSFLEAVVVLLFSMIYIAIGVDTVVIFIPALQGLKDFVEGNNAPVQENLFSDSQEAG